MTHTIIQNQEESVQKTILEQMKEVYSHSKISEKFPIRIPQYGNYPRLRVRSYFPSMKTFLESHNLPVYAIEEDLEFGYVTIIFCGDINSHVNG